MLGIVPFTGVRQPLLHEHGRETTSLLSHLTFFSSTFLRLNPRRLSKAVSRLTSRSDRCYEQKHERGRQTCHIGHLKGGRRVADFTIETLDP
jgi:hypothetical protein